MNITYTQNGDYLIPNIVIRKTKPLRHYGRLRKAYLEMHRPILFNDGCGTRTETRTGA